MTLDELRAGITATRSERTRVRDKIELAARQLANTPDGADAAGLRAQIESLRNEFARQRSVEMSQFGARFDPRDLFTQFDGAIPTLLFPLRIQTRFDGDNFIVRVYPDEISVQSHDPRLSVDERASGALFYAAPEATEVADIKTQRDVWRGIVQRFGLRRAAWILRATDPARPALVDDPGGITLRVPAAWTLPERLIFRFYDTDERLMNEQIGEPIPDGLEMSFDPTRADLGLARRDGDLDMGPEFLWQTDIDAAVKVGMAIVIPVDALRNARNIGKIIVLGVRLSATASQGAALLERLIEDHRFTDGFGIVAQGTPTNVTDHVDAPGSPDVDAELTRLRGIGAFGTDVSKTPYDRSSDALRLAQALGISPEATRYLENGDRHDGAEAIAMKRALWAGTLGYYAQQMLAPNLEPAIDPAGNDPHLSDRLIEHARFIFTNFVFGRGPLPAIRAGDQPYGILPISSAMLRAEPGKLPIWGNDILDRFVDNVAAKTLALVPTWQRLAGDLARAKAGAGAAADTRLIDVLSAQANAVSFTTETFIGKTYLKDYVDFKDPNNTKEFDDYVKLLDARFAKFEAEFPGLFPRKPRIFDLSFYGTTWRSTVAGVGKPVDDLVTVLDRDVIDKLPFSERRTIDAAYPNYIEAIASGDFAAARRGIVRTLADGKTEPVTALLYLLLRHSYLHEYAFAAMRLHHHFQQILWASFAEKEIYNISWRFDRTYWDYLEHPAAWPLGPGGAPVTTTALNLVQQRDSSRATLANWSDHFGDVDEMHVALKMLAPLPTARLERLFAEHLDLSNYRLDAWITATTYQRLFATRVLPKRDANIPLFRGNRFDLAAAPIGTYATGIYLGAYGWVEDIVASAPPEPVADLPAELNPSNGKPTGRVADNFGFVHAPSLNHAVTAALLRSASVTEPDTTAFNVDLSSARVREALWIIEGVRNGQAPAALLGYKFERALREHDARPGDLLKLQQYLPALRAAYTMPQHPDTAPGTEAAPARDVVNGLKLVQAERAGTIAMTIAGLAPAAPPAALDAIVALASDVVAAFDACSDLMLAESVHQAAQGKYDRAGGIVTAAGEFAHVPSEFEVVETPRSGAALTHRVLLGFNAAVGEAPLGTSPQSRLAPQLNAWLARMIGPLDKLACAVGFIIENDDTSTTSFSYTTTLEGLALEPIDLLFLLDDRSSNEFATRIATLVRARFDAEHVGKTPIALTPADLFAIAPVGTRALGELAPLLDRIRAMVTHARSATQRDLLAPSDLHGKTPDETDAIDADDLLWRVLGVKSANPIAQNPDSLWNAYATMLATFDALDGITPEILTARLQNAAQFGVAGAYPDPLHDLKAQAERVGEAVRDRFAKAQSLWTPPTAPASDVLGVCRKIVDALIGNALPLMPHIQAVADLPTAAFPPGAPDIEAREDWLLVASLLREDAATLQHARALASATAQGFEDLHVFQWPIAERAWIANPPPAGKRFGGDLVSIVMQTAGAFDASQPIVALHLDEWHEVIPNETEITGITFNYRTARAEPPQTILLAVSQRQPNNNLRWTWDELVASVEQALELAKMRAVGPEEIRRTSLDAVLPATVTADAAAAATITTGLRANVSDKIAVDRQQLWNRT